MAANRRHSFDAPEKLQVFTSYGPCISSILLAFILPACNQH